MSINHYYLLIKLIESCLINFEKDLQFETEK